MTATAAGTACILPSLVRKLLCLHKKKNHNFTKSFYYSIGVNVHIAPVVNSIFIFMNKPVAC